MTESDKAVMQQALDALENSSDFVSKDVSKSHLRGEAIAALYEAIAQPVQTIHKNMQPIAYALQWPSDSRINLSTVFDTLAETVDYKDSCGTEDITVVSLYAAAQHRVHDAAIAQPEQTAPVRQPLTEAQIDTICQRHWAAVRASPMETHRAFANPIDAYRAFARAIEAKITGGRT